MTWVALADQWERRFSLRGIGIDKQSAPVLQEDAGGAMMRGTLMFETRFSPEERPKVLLGYRHMKPAQRSLTIQVVPGGGIALVQVHNQSVAHAALPHVASNRAEMLRISYSWDISKNWARLTVERPDQYGAVSILCRDPLPMAMSDHHDMMMGSGDQIMASDVVFAALSNDVEPIGPMPSLAPDTPVATPAGYRKAQDLRRGDTIITRGGDIVPVLHVISHSLPTRGSFAPVRLRAPYMGLQCDVVVGPEQRIVLDGPEVEYLFGEEAVLVPARHLLNGFAAMVEPARPVERYVQIILPAHEAMFAGGALLESLYIGRIRRKREVFEGSLLSGADRNMLPEHGRAGFKVLRWFEAVHLASRRAA